MSEINEISENDKIEDLKLNLLGWDAVINGKPFQIVRVEGKIHTKGGKYGENDLYAYPLSEEPAIQNLIPFNGSAPSWGIHIEEGHYYKDGYFSGREYRRSVHGSILRNGVIVHSQVSNDIAYLACALQVKLMKLYEHPTNTSERGWPENLVGRKMFYENKPVIIERVRDGLSLILKPDGFTQFPAPVWASEDTQLGSTNPRDYLVVDFFDDRIYWFRK
jgi:hypothetical protein